MIPADFVVAGDASSPPLAAQVHFRRSSQHGTPRLYVSANLAPSQKRTPRLL